MASRSGKAEGLIGDGALGDAGSVDRLYRLFAAGLRRRIARRFGGGPPDPDDAVQAAFEGYARLEDRSLVADPEAFLYRSASNFVLEHHRKARVRFAHADSVRQDGTEADDFTAERILVSKERLQVIDQAIASMDQRRRDVLIMNRIHGLSYAEIARRLDRSPTLVKMLVAEALILCERALREAGWAEDEA